MAVTDVSLASLRGSPSRDRGGADAGASRDRDGRRTTAIAPLALGATVLLVWETAARLGAISPVFLPAPSAIAQRLWREITEGRLLSYAGTTATAALLGCLLGAGVAFPMGYLIARFRTVGAALHPYVAASQALPAVAIAPLLVLWVGYGLTPVVLLCALLVFFPILLATVLGLRSIDPDLIDAARLDGAAGCRLLGHIEIPLALPSLLTGLRNGATLSITGAVVGEFVTGGAGLGLVLTVAASATDATGLFAAIALLVAMAITLYTVLRGAEALTWYERQRREGRRVP